MCLLGYTAYGVHLCNNIFMFQGKHNNGPARPQVPRSGAWVPESVFPGPRAWVREHTCHSRILQVYRQQKLVETPKYYTSLDPNTSRGQDDVS